MSKEGSTFCYPGNISREMDKLFDGLRQKGHLKELALEVFIPAASHFLADLNAIHPFREGNGRTQTTFMVLLAVRAGRKVDVTWLRPKRFLAAMIMSFDGNEQPLRTELREFIS